MLLPAGAPVVINRDEPYAEKADGGGGRLASRDRHRSRRRSQLKLLDVAREGFSAAR
jgi:UDP-N-acetylmuramoyl-L-alanyl-D-glutamate--2,6-diaminopimelate ligase